MASNSAWRCGNFMHAVSSKQNVYIKSPTVNLFNTIGKTVLHSFYSFSSSRSDSSSFNNGM